MNNIKKSQKFHTPILTDEVLEHLDVKKDGVYVDGTLGGGGHSRALLENNQFPNPNVHVIGIDHDQEAIIEAKKNLKEFSNITFVKDNFINIDDILKEKKVDGILLDLGVSSHQLDDKSRGFSFSEDEENLKMPLDMRMDSDNDLMAKDVVNGYLEKRLANILYEYGEERNSRKIAKAIVRTRKVKPMETVGDLIEIIRSVIHPKMIHNRRKHFATNVFRALRIEVNSELQVIKDVIPKAIDALKIGGRLLVITFHSLEDRIVKHDFRNYSRIDNPKIKLITKKPITPSEDEINSNPRSRSAKLRVVEKLG